MSGRGGQIFTTYKLKDHFVYSLRRTSLTCSSFIVMKSFNKHWLSQWQCLNSDDITHSGVLVSDG